MPLRSFPATLALVALALLASLYSFIRDIIQLIGYAGGCSTVLADERRRRATLANCYALPFTCIRILLNLVATDTPYLITVIEYACGSVYWVHAYTVKHFAQYSIVRQTSRPAFLSALATQAGIQ